MRKLTNLLVVLASVCLVLSSCGEQEEPLVIKLDYEAAYDAYLFKGSALEMNIELFTFEYYEGMEEQGITAYVESDEFRFYVGEEVVAYAPFPERLQKGLQNVEELRIVLYDERDNGSAKITTTSSSKVDLK